MTNKELQKLLAQYPDDAKLIGMINSSACRVNAYLTGYDLREEIIETADSKEETKYLLITLGYLTGEL